MKLVERTTLPVPPSAVRPHVADLTAYPRWLDLVSRVRPTESATDETGPAWFVDLRGRVGPLARSKRLRMVRVLDDVHHLRFERREVSGRRASPWQLDVQLAGEETTELTMHLAYGGRWWGPVIERVLRDAVAEAKPELRRLVQAD